MLKSTFMNVTDKKIFHMKKNLFAKSSSFDIQNFQTFPKIAAIFRHRQREDRPK